MKVAIYIENGITQLVLTPQGEWEEQVCAKLASNGEKCVTITRGSFYETRGGWMRHSMDRDDQSLILRVDDVREPHPPAQPDSLFASPDRSPSNE